jgi:subtilase family serine protease
LIRKTRAFLLAIFAMTLGANIVCQAAQPQSLLTRHVREVVLNGEAQSVGRLPAAQSMQIDVVLPLRDQAGLESFLRDLYDPLNPSYRQYLTVQEFTDMFGPRQEDYDAVVRFAKANGFTVVGGSRDAMDVQLKGSVASIESAFHVTMGVYQHPTENRTFYAPDREPAVDLPFQLWHISGLDNYSIPRPALEHRNAGAHSLATTGSCPSKSFCGSDMRAAYYEGTALTGAGQNIGLFEYAGFDIADVNTYYKNAGQTRTAAVKGISTDGTSINCFYKNRCDDTEQTLDITQALGMAPGVATAYVYVGSTDTAILGAMTTDTPLPLNLSCSWGWTPADPNTDDPYYERMATQGQSFFVAAGDSRKWSKSNYPYPAEDANVITVGGTDLTTQSAGGPWKSEVGWADTGGGISPDKIAIPSWQQLTGVITSANKGSTVYRNGPDVTGNANFTFYVCADQTTCTANDYGGTSFAAPMWAGYLALANQQAATDGDAPPGFINPTIYPLALGSSYHTLFHDITSGNNGFPATAGYDLDSGWGSPNGSALINALAAP